jgi:hypothetical protein
VPYEDGKRISNEEWTAKHGSIAQLHTGPGGENPGESPELDAETAAPVSKKRAGGNRSGKSAKAAKAAVADALGVKGDSPALDDIDVSSLDVDADVTGFHDTAEEVPAETETESTTTNDPE